MTRCTTKHRLDRIEHQLRRITNMLEALETAVAEDVTVDQAAITLLNGLSQQIKDIIAAGVDPAALQSLVDELDSSTSALSDAVTANTPAAPA